MLGLQTLASALLVLQRNVSVSSIIMKGCQQHSLYLEDNSCLSHSAGKHSAKISTPSPDKLVIDLEWEDPYGGVGVDEWTMPSQDELHVVSAITIGGKTTRYRQVYNRKK
jgi:hypothetical protein